LTVAFFDFRFQRLKKYNHSFIESNCIFCYDVTDLELLPVGEYGTFNKYNIFQYWYEFDRLMQLYPVMIFAMRVCISAQGKSDDKGAYSCYVGFTW